MSTAGVDSHMRCRKLVCVVCYKKGNRDISANEQLWIQDNLIDGYDANDANFPAAMCAHFHILLSQRINGIDMKQQLAKVESYDPEQTLGSKPKPVAAVKPKKQLFTAQDMSVIQKDLSLSTRQVLTLAEDLRNSSGDKKMIEKKLEG